uniref:PPM-type phosphatase domain-containing protein n=1 Tax=Tetradesmus obliquus TaxID=3088 RepID=A0A383WM94_TETOB|eukprot:jgi/Sobl393_1/11077/SZX67901.1
MGAEGDGQAATALMKRPESPQGAPAVTTNCNSNSNGNASAALDPAPALSVDIPASSRDSNAKGLHSPFAADEQQNRSGDDTQQQQQKASQDVPASSPAAASSPRQKQQQKQQQQRRTAKRPSADSTSPQQAAQEPAAAATGSEGEDGEQHMQAVKRRKPAAAANHEQQQQQVHKQHSSDHSHIRKHHAVDDDEGNGTRQKEAAAAAAAEPQPLDAAAAAAAAAPPTSSLQQHGKHQQHHKRNKGQPKQLLSFTEEEDAEEAAAAAPAEAAAPATTTTAAAPSDNSSQEQQEQQPAKHSHGSIARATASRFAQEIKAQAAAAARMMFRPSGSAAVAGAAGAGAAGGAAAGAVLVDEDEDPRAAARAAATAGLSQIHFGFATARGHRPYMEDRHTIITALNPATAQQAAAALDAAEHLAAGGDESAANGREQQHAAVTHDGVGRCYAAIFDGHNGAGAAETAARKLHLLLASHPALRLYRGEMGPPAIVKQEEAAVGSALKHAFRQVDDMVLSTARHEGTRDGATALVLLRLGNALYAAHAGDSRAVLCRDAAAYRLTEDHKPHLPHERSRIEEAGGRVDFQRCWRVVVEPRDGRPGSGLAVSRSLGDLDFKEPYRYVECEPDVTRLPLQPRRDTFVVLGSDGLWDVLSDTDAVITAAAALKAYTANHSSNSNAGSSPAGAIDATGSSNSSIPCGLALHMGRARHKPGQHGSGPHARGSAFGGLGSAELPDSLVYSDAAATAAAEALLAESMRRGTMDNVTVIVMLLQWS